MQVMVPHLVPASNEVAEKEDQKEDKISVTWTGKTPNESFVPWVVLPNSWKVTSYASPHVPASSQEKLLCSYSGIPRECWRPYNIICSKYKEKEQIYYINKIEK